MFIEIDNGSGFCFGVTTAISKAEEELNETGHLYCLGDSSGWTRGLMMASVMGVYCGQILSEIEKQEEK